MSGEKVVADSDTMLFEILSYHLSSVNLSAGIALVCHLFNTSDSLSLAHKLDISGQLVVVNQILAADPAALLGRDVAGDLEVTEHSNVVLQIP